MKTLFLALALALPAAAAPIQTIRLHEAAQTEKGLHADLVEVQSHRSPASVIATDALYGGIAGLAIGGGVALLSSDSNWGRDLAVGAGAGLLIGGIFGAVDAASMTDQVARPVGEYRDVGFSRSVSPLGGKF